MLKPGESEIVRLQLAVEDMTSYDEIEKCYVLDSGDYIVSLRTDSHNVKIGESIYEYTYHVDEKVVYNETNPRQSDEMAATNAFDDNMVGISEDFKVMSRSDFAGTFPS